MKVCLTRIESTHNNLRTDVVEGEALWEPVVGSHFVMTAKSLTDPVKTRVITTSTITSISLLDNRIFFETENSTYCLEKLE